MTEAPQHAPPGGGLDHVVINVLRDMDDAAALFAALGFQLTPLGRHSFGSINHLMMTPGAYLELVGVPETGLQRQDVLESPFGLNGLVLASRDAAATFAELSAAGLPIESPVAFFRPVTIDGRIEEARFRTVRFPTDTFPAGRVYYCEHLTPDLVWHEPWLTHPNGFCGIDGLRVASPDPEADAARFAAACRTQAERSQDGWRIPLGNADLHVVAGPKPCFLDLALRFRTLAEIEALAELLPAAQWTRTGPDEANVFLPALDLRLRCRTR